ncbi:hypothetical protein RB595_006274 [Gaeumannomyces hyphopodioides]
MAPGALLPDSPGGSPTSETAGGGFVGGYWARLRGAAVARLSTGFQTNISDHTSDGHYTDDHSTGDVNGHANGHVNGDANNRANGGPNGDVPRVSSAAPRTAAGTAPTTGLRDGAATSDHRPAIGPKASTGAIAIVGMSCRMPGNVSSADEFWELLSRNRSGFSEIPKERFNPASFYHPNPGKGGCYNPVGGNFLQCDLRDLDAPFFGLTEKEAISMDPQQRLLLECAFEALENGGIPKHHIVGKNVGVFIGGSFPEYESHLFRDSDTIPMHQATGCAYAMQANRISHFFDLRGPSFTSDTACSSSMVAVHLACQSLRAGESSLALVGGCHLNMLPEFWISFSTCRLLSDSGKSMAFDSRGTGFGRGEGCAMIVLKPLEQALKDNDAIRAVIAGSGINQDGKTPGITMPNGEAQESLMRQVYRDFNLNPWDCGFVEAHGTGTKVGDPIEATAIHNVLGKRRTVREPLLIGSVKSNIGHLEGASGIAGILKGVMMLERSFVLPNHDFKSPNPKIPWKEWNLKVPPMQRPFPRGKKYVSVNNFGFGGTNGHVVLETAPFREKEELTENELDKQPKLIVFSANDKTALQAILKNTVIYLERRPEVFEGALMRNIAYTLGQRRSLLPWRVAMHARESLSLIEVLNGGRAVVHKEMESVRIGYIFTGQGAQWWAMGRELYSHYPVYTDSLDRADRCLASLGSGWSLVKELAKSESSTLVSEAHISQPSCTAIQLALVDLLQNWGVRPTAVAGHSSGEIAAAYAAGIISFESAVKIAYHRGRLIPVLRQRFPDLQGRMMAVGGSKDEVQQLIDGLDESQVRIACFNSPSSLTTSGDEVAVAALERVVEQKQMFNRRLVVDVAYHSHHMNLVSKEYRAALTDLPAPVPSNVKFHSSLAGGLVDGTELQPSYWVNNLTCPVRFSEAVESMLQPADGFKVGVNALVELGPHSALQGPIKQILKAVGGSAAKITYDSALIRKKNAVETALDLAGSLFTKGVNLDLGAVNFPKPGIPPVLQTDMPRYPWNYQTKYWQESRMTAKHKQRSQPRSDILGVEAIYSNDLEPTWRNIIRLDDLPWLRQHKIQSLTMCPMSAFIVMVLEAASQRAVSSDRRVDRLEMRDITIVKPLIIPDDDIEITTALRPHQEGTLVSSDVWDEFRICSYSSSVGWTEHCVGLVATLAHETNDVDGARQRSDSETMLRTAASAVQDSGPVVVRVEQMYDAMAGAGVAFGPAFQGLKDCEASSTHATAKVHVDDLAKEMPSEYLASPLIHPCVIESLIGMYWPVLSSGQSKIGTVYLPSAVSRVSISAHFLEISKTAGRSLRAYCSADFDLGASKPARVTTMAAASDHDTEPLIILEGLLVAPILEGETQMQTDAPRELCYKLEWEPVLVPEHRSSEKPNGSPGNGESSPGPFHSLSVVIVYDDSVLQRSVAQGLVAAMEKVVGRVPEIGQLSTVQPEGKILVFLSELDTTLLSTISATQFELLQGALVKADGCLWVVRGAYASSTSPEANMIAGLSRSIRSETTMRFATLDLDGHKPLAEELICDAVMRVFREVFGPSATNTSELEFMERGGAFFTPRIVNDDLMNVFVREQTNPTALEDSPFASDDRQLRLTVPTPGALETLHFIDDPAAGERLTGDQIEIDIRAIGVSFRDVMAAKGQTAEDLGHEVSGVVASVGPEAAGLAVGERVAALVQGGYASKVRAPIRNVFKLPAAMSFEAAATLPLAYCTAYYSLFELGRLEQGESVLIHSAAGPVGQAAIVLAQTAQAKIFVTVGTAEKKALIMEEYGIPDERILYSRRTAFGNTVREATDGKGIDVVLNSATGDALQASWECLNDFGRLIDIGGRDGSAKTRLEMTSASKNSTFISLDLFAVVAEKPRVIERVIGKVSRLLGLGKIRPLTPVTVYGISEVETALKKMQSARLAGKLVVVPQPGEVVQATRSLRGTRLLRADATYVLIGGTGGLGRSMARWMVGNGAQHIALVSRSGSARGKLRELIQALEELGAEVVVHKCNVVSRDEVDDLLKNGLRGMPAVRGVVHGTMVLHDVLFEKMTWEEYVKVTEGKVQGAWNLHRALADKELDFFVAISSAAGAVGNRGQAAYAAANCFLNALVQHRLSLGLPASSLDLTMVSDAGYLAGNADKLAEVARNLGSDSICESEVLALLGAAIEGRLAATCNNHAITGMRITSAMQPFWASDAKFKHLRSAMETQAAQGEGGSSSDVSFGAAAKAAQSLEEAESAVCRGLVDKISTVLMLEPEDMDVTRSLSHYPLDSLVAIEIRNFIAREFEANMQVLELLSSGSIQTLARTVCAKSKLVSFT